MRIKTTYRKEKCSTEIKIEDSASNNCNETAAEPQVEQSVEIDSNHRKRTTLSECIDEIYMISGVHLPKLQPAIKKSDISRNINLLLKSQNVTSLERNKMISAKRQLFRVQRNNVRKQRKPKYNKISKMSTLMLDFRSIRGLLRKKRVRKNIFNDVGNKLKIQNATIENENENLNDVSIDSDCTEDASEVEAEEEPYEEGDVPFEETAESKEEESALMRTQLWAEQQYNMGIEAHDQIMEETLRTVYYLKTLSSLMCY